MTMLNAMEAELETARKIFWLLREDQIFLSGYNDDHKKWDDGAYPAINCNDVFVTGADAEKLDTEDLDKFIEVVKRFPNVGNAAWCGVKRAAKPWRNFKDPEWQMEYEKALEFVKEILGDGGRDDNVRLD